MGLLNPPVIEQHDVQGHTVTVVRDDLCCPWPGPNNAKMRGLELLLEKARQAGHTTVVSVNTNISRLGWGVSWMTRQMGMTHIDGGFAPQTFFSQMSQSWGGRAILVPATHVSIAEKFVACHLTDTKAFWLPRGLRSQATLEAYDRLLDGLDGSLFAGSVVLCASSGTIMTALLYAMEKRRLAPDVFGIMPCRMPEKVDRVAGLLREAGQAAPPRARFQLVDSGFDYSQRCLEPSPFPCDVYLDRKAWHWLTEHLRLLRKPVTFWNIGGEWDYRAGLDGGLRGDGLTAAADVHQWLEEHRGQP